MPPHDTTKDGPKPDGLDDSGLPRAANHDGGPMIWALGGGKGGIGKSFIATNLAVSVARLGFRVTLLDADLGGANLDTFLGCPHPTMSLGDFFRKRVASLDELAMDTGIPGLNLIAGDADSLAAASPHYSQKMKLIRHLRKISSSLVIVDLGAGTSFHTLDLFNAADLGLVVTVPEPTALQNCFSFIKSVTLRDLERRSGVKRRETMVGDLKRTLDPSDPEVQRALSRRIPLIVNRARPAHANNVVRTLGNLTTRFLGGTLELQGSVRDDNAARASIQKMEPLLECAPASPAAADLDALAATLMGRARAHLTHATGQTTPHASSPDIASANAPSGDALESTVLHEARAWTVRTYDLGDAEPAIVSEILSSSGELGYRRQTAYDDPFFTRLGASRAERPHAHHAAIQRALSSGRIQLATRRRA